MMLSRLNSLILELQSAALIFCKDGEREREPKDELNQHWRNTDGALNLEKEVEEEEKEKKNCLCDRLCHVWRHVTLEPAYMMFAMGMGMYYIFAAQLYIEKVPRPACTLYIQK